MSLRTFTYHGYCILVLNSNVKKIYYKRLLASTDQKPIDNNDQGWWY